MDRPDLGLIQGLRMAVEEALSQPTAHVEQQLTLLAGLNTFGHHIQIQGPGEVQDRPDQDAAARVGDHGGGEGVVELEAIDWQIHQ